MANPSNKKTTTSPLLQKYLTSYENNPKSRVFAPLAESYRKLGMINEALEVLKKGIKLHPTYVLGYLCLASCYYDLKKYELAYNTLRPLVSENLDNILMQKLFASVCKELGNIDEALNTYKYLLYVNPRDLNVAREVSELEEKYVRDEQVIDTENIRKELEDPAAALASYPSAQTFDVEKIGGQAVNQDLFADEESWTLVNFAQKEPKTAIQEIEEEQKQEDMGWTVKQQEDVLFEGSEKLVEISNEVILHNDRELDPTQKEASSIHATEQDEVVEEEEKSLQSEQKENIVPVLTLTLVDIYVSQGHYGKAIEVLEKIKELNPQDERVSKRLAELKGRNIQVVPIEVTPPVAAAPVNVQDDNNDDELLEESGHSDLMQLFDQQMFSNKDRKQKLERKYKLFLSRLKTLPKTIHFTDSST